MRFFRRRTARPDSARSRLATNLEVLEGRALLTGGHQNPLWQFQPELFGQYSASDLPITNPRTGESVPFSVGHSLSHNSNPNNPLFSNEGKLVSGKDRAGNEWTITVHGPGYVIVSDLTPNDGVLADDIDRIQLIGTDINNTYVTGNLVTSFRVPDDSTINFNQLTSTTGVNTIDLNGFTLSQTVVPTAGLPNNSETGIFLSGGVRHLSFHNVEAPVDTSTNDFPVNIVIGDPSTPLDVKPTITIDHIFNTVFDSTATTAPANVPLTSPTVNIIVNGEIQTLDMVSVGQMTVDASQHYLFPTVGTTGRTSVQTTGIGHLGVRAGATNLTASRSATPFQNGFTSLSHIDGARFAGPTDAVGLDVSKGRVGSVQYDRGMGNPRGTFIAATTDGAGLPSTKYGVPADQVGYAALGYLGGQVVANRIDKVAIGPGDLRLQTVVNPDFIQLYRQGNTAYFTRPGTAMVNSLVSSSQNIGSVKVVGQTLNSEIKSGFDYASFANGLEGTRAPSRLGPVHVRGDLTNGVLSATYRPFQHFYGTPLDTAGPGALTGTSDGVTTTTNGITPLTNVGSGYFARQKSGGYLPPPQVGDFAHGRRIRGA